MIPHVMFTGDLLKKFGYLILFVPMVVGCTMRIQFSSGSFSQNVSASPGSDWTDEQRMLLRYQLRDGHASLESERLVLVFHGLSQKQQRMFHFQGTQQPIQISGPGVSSISTTCAIGRGMIAFRSDYTDGTNTFGFNELRVRLVQGGRLLLAGDQMIDLNEGQKVIHLRDDKITVE